MQNTLIEIYDKVIQGNVYAVGDLHGCYDLLMQNLKVIGFDFERDLLVSVGDLVDRGEQSVACVGLLNKPWFKAIRGNHEQLCIDGLLDESIAQIHVRPEIGGDWFYQLDENLKEEIVEKFLKLPIVLEVQHHGKKFGFVHGDVNLNDWDELKQAVIDGHDSVIQNCLWGRTRVKAAADDVKNLRVQGVDLIYLGHTPIKHSFQQQNCLFIDTGAVFSGNLTIVKLGH